MSSRVVAFFQHHLLRLIAIVPIVVCYSAARTPELSPQERSTLASRFSFTRSVLPEVAGATPTTIRQVHPSLQNISAWISSVGGAVALNDLDGDGLSNDTCYVETRTNQVIVAPVPGAGTRYSPFVLEAGTLPYDQATVAPMGCLPGDLNEDGRQDILVYYWGRTPIIFLQRAQAEGQQRTALQATDYVQQELSTQGERWYTNAATLADFDGDGHLDLLLGNYFPDGSRILDSKATTQEFMQRSMSRAYNGGQDHLFAWAGATAGADPAVQFNEIKDIFAADVANGWTLALGAADLDGDLLPELYIANDFGPDRLLYNQSEPGVFRFKLIEGQKTLTTPSSKVLGRGSFKGMGVDFGDLNDDGYLDIYVSNIADDYALEESHYMFLSTGRPEQMRDGIAPYTDRSEPLGLSRSGWGWEARLNDFDNDGVLEALQATGFVKGETNRWPELHELAMGNDNLLHISTSWPHIQEGADLSGQEHNPFFVRSASGRYYDIAPDIGLGEAQVTRGIATADVDGDGRLDFALGNQWIPSLFFHNTSPNNSSFLGLHLQLPLQQATGTTSVHPGHPAALEGRPAIGATATVHLPNGKQLVAQIDGGNGHSGKRSPELHFGLGDLPADTPIQVDLRWRDTQGVVHQETVSLTPGWHTVRLGW